MQNQPTEAVVSQAYDHLSTVRNMPGLSWTMQRIMWWMSSDHTNPSSKGDPSHSGSEGREPASAANEATSSSEENGVHPSRRRRWPWLVCAALAVFLLLVGNIGVWIARNIADTSNFVETTREVLEREDVREALATRIVDNVVFQYPIAGAALEDSLVSVVTGLLGSDRLQPVLDRVATQLHQAVILGERQSITIESPELQTAVLAAVRTFAPEQASRLALEGDTLRIELFSGVDLPSYESEISTLRRVGFAAGIIGALLVILPIVVLRDRWSVTLAGLTLVTMSLLTFLLVLLGGQIIDQQVTGQQAQIVIAGIVDEFSSMLIVQTVVILLVGIGLCIYGFGLTSRMQLPRLPIEARRRQTG